MSFTVDDRVLALAGIAQALQQVRRIADTGHSDAAAVRTDTISHLKPRVMVQGNPHYLGQAGVVAEIRALLLAAVRAAVLWRQLGGSYWDFLFSRKAMIEAVDRQLA